MRPNVCHVTLTCNAGFPCVEFDSVHLIKDYRSKRSYIQKFNMWIYCTTLVNFIKENKKNCTKFMRLLLYRVLNLEDKSISKFINDTSEVDKSIDCFVSVFVFAFTASELFSCYLKLRL